MDRVDIHQHLWPERLIDELSRRDHPPFIRKAGARWKLRLQGEPDHLFDLSQHDATIRARRLAEEGIDRALISLSTPLGIEGLPADEAEPLLESYHDGVLEIGEPFAAWASTRLRSPDASRVDEELDRGLVGLTLPAGALSTREGLVRCRPLLSRLEARGAPLFIHPGPDPLEIRFDQDEPSADPAWWPAMTAYVAQMNAAWHAFAAWGRLSHPGLRVVFAMLAGGATLHHERYLARGGPAGAISDPDVFYDTSSYGGRALDAAVRVVGIDQLVYGSDRPVIDPPPPTLLGEAAAEAMLRTNPARALDAAAPEPAVAVAA
jgi:predicted TIM-barrel fold metal-dependent hydrolase